MNPVWSKRAGEMMASQYWHPDDDDEFLARQDDFLALQEAVQQVESYDDLSDEMKALWDRAEESNKEWEEFLASDTEGMGRFLDDRTTRAAPTPPPELEDADSDESAVPAPSLEEEPEVQTKKRG